MPKLLPCPRCRKKMVTGAAYTSKRYGGVECSGCRYRVDGPRDTAAKAWNRESQRQRGRP